MNENMLYDTTIKCIVCNNEFKTKKVKKSKTRLIKKDDDFCPYYKTENPMYYDFFVCPKCGTVFTEKFSKINSEQKESLKNIFKDIKNISHLSGKRTIHDALRLAKLSLISSNICNLSPVIKAGICMKIAWFNRYLNNKEEEKKFLKYALNEYENAYSLGDNQIPEENLIYILGELNWRLDNFQGSQIWFNKLLSLKSDNIIIRKAKERWYEIKEMHKKEISA